MKLVAMKRDADDDLLADAPELPRYPSGLRPSPARTGMDDGWTQR